MPVTTRIITDDSGSSRKAPVDGKTFDFTRSWCAPARH